MLIAFEHLLSGPDSSLSPLGKLTHSSYFCFQSYMFGVHIALFTYLKFLSTEIFFIQEKFFIINIQC